MTGLLHKTALGGDDGHVPIRVYWHSPTSPGTHGLYWLNNNFGSSSIDIRIQPIGLKLIFVPFYTGHFEARDHYDIRACGEDFQGFMESIPPDRYHIFVFGLEPLAENLIYPSHLFAPGQTPMAYLMQPTHAAKKYIEDVQQYGFDEVPYAEPLQTSPREPQIDEVLELDLSRARNRGQRMAIVANIVIGLRTTVVLHEVSPTSSTSTAALRAPDILEEYVEPQLPGCKQFLETAGEPQQTKPTH